MDETGLLAKLGQSLNYKKSLALMSKQLKCN
jgi:hypothetical protein